MRRLTSGKVPLEKTLYGELIHAFHADGVDEWLRVMMVGDDG